MKNCRKIITNIVFVFFLFSSAYIFGQTKTPTKWGVIDSIGNIIVPFEYDVITYRFNSERSLPKDILAAQKDGRWGIIDRNAKVLVPFIYEGVTDFTNTGLVIAKKGGLYGLIDIRGNVRIPFQYDKLSFRGSKLLEAQSTNKGTFSGKANSILLIDTLGQKIYPEIVNSTAPYIGNDRLWVSQIENLDSKDEQVNWFAIDQKGNVKIPPTGYDNIYNFRDGVCLVKLDNKFGVIDTLGKVVVPIEYDFYNYNLDTKYDLICLKKDDKVHLFDTKGQELASPIYSSVKPISEDLFVVRKDGMYGFINRKGETIVDFNYKAIAGKVSNGVLIVQEKEGKWGAVDVQGNILSFAPQIEWVANFRNEYAVAKQAGKYGIIDKKGVFVIPPKYRSVDDVSSSYTYYAAKYDILGETEIISLKDETIITTPYDVSTRYFKDLFHVYMEENENGTKRSILHGVLSFTSNKLIIPVEYEKIQRRADYFILERKDLSTTEHNNIKH